MNAFLCFLLLLTAHQGRVMFGNIPVPGATVTATQWEKKFVTVTDPQGAYSFSELEEGAFTIQVEMPGFATIRQELSGPTATIEMEMLPPGEMHAQAAQESPAAAAAGTSSKTPQPSAQPNQAGFRQAEVNVADAGAASAVGGTVSQFSAFANLSGEELSRRAADGFPINGSVSNAAASQFGQPFRIGNNVRGVSLYRGNASVVLDNSALDARSYSFTGQDTPKPAYNRLTGSFTIGGPLLIPHLIRRASGTFSLSYQRLQNRNAVTTAGRVPSRAERDGHFSQSFTPFGQPVEIIDPHTGSEFDGNVIPRDRVSPQARALLDLFPFPNFNETARYNYQIPVVGATHQDAVQGRVTRTISQKSTLVVNFDVQSVRSDTANLFNFVDASRLSGINASVQWTARFSQRAAAIFRYQFGRQSS